MVAAAGGATRRRLKYAPANCMGVITVGKPTKAGTRVSFSNYGTRVNISALRDILTPVHEQPLTALITLKFSYDRRERHLHVGTARPALLAQQLVNGTSMTTKQVEEAFTTGTNRIKCDKYSVDEGTSTASNWLNRLET